VIVEPVSGNMGFVPPLDDFLPGLREITANDDALLIFDEVMTGFRVHPGGAQTLYNVQPDITALGKVIGGGLPVGAYGGRREIMALVAPSGPMYQAGTLSGNPLAMTAGIETLKGAATTGRLGGARGAGGATARRPDDGRRREPYPRPGGTDWHDVRPLLRRRASGQLDDGQQSQYERFAAYFQGMLERGVYLAPSQFEAGFISTAHGEREIEATIRAATATLEALPK
jgi:glutamate-1-semialdehyde 2,1-aminomutase